MRNTTPFGETGYQKWNLAPVPNEDDPGIEDTEFGDEDEIEDMDEDGEDEEEEDEVVR